MHSNSDPFLLVSILWKIGLLLDCGWTSKAIAGTVDILPLRVSVGWLLLPESEKRWMPFCIQPIQDHNAGLPFQLLGGCGDSVPILSETENGRDGLRWWWDGHEQVGRETSSIYSILYTFEHLWSMHQAPRKHNEDDLAPACSCEEGLGPSLGDLRRVFQVVSRLWVQVFVGCPCLWRRSHFCTQAQVLVLTTAPPSSRVCQILWRWSSRRLGEGSRMVQQQQLQGTNHTKHVSCRYGCNMLPNLRPMKACCRADQTKLVCFNCFDMIYIYMYTIIYIQVSDSHSFALAAQPRFGQVRVSFLQTLHTSS